MIILRQKNYSSPLAKTLYGIGKFKNRLSTLPARLTRGYHRNITGNLGEEAIANLRVKQGTKSKAQLRRQAIEKSQQAKTKSMEVLNASTSPEGVRDYVGKKAGTFVEMAAENPITTAGVAVGYGSTPIQVATGTYWGPIGSASTAAEQFLKRKSPRYKKATDNLSNLSKKRHWGEKTSGAIQSILVPVM